MLPTTAARLFLGVCAGGRGQKLLPTVVAAKVERLSIAFGVESRASSTVIPQMGSLVMDFDSFLSCFFLGRCHCTLIFAVTLFRAINSDGSTGHGTNHSNAHVPAKMRSKALALGCGETFIFNQSSLCWTRLPQDGLPLFWQRLTTHYGGDFNVCKAEAVRNSGSPALQFHATQTQRVTDDRDGTQAHRGAWQ